jgi:hypothetical protein
MHDSRFIRVAAALLMILGLTLPLAAPASAHITTASATPAAPCQVSTDGTARFFVTVVGSDGADITNATSQLVGTGTVNGGTIVPMPVGNYETESACPAPPAEPTAHSNDYANSVFVTDLPVTNLWRLVITAPGYATSVTDLSAFTDTTGVGTCLTADGTGCLLALGTVTLTAPRLWQAPRPVVWSLVRFVCRQLLRR